MEATVFLIFFKSFLHHMQFWRKLWNITQMFPSFSWCIFSHVKHLDGLYTCKNIPWGHNCRDCAYLANHDSSVSWWIINSTTCIVESQFLKYLIFQTSNNSNQNLSFPSPQSNTVIFYPQISWTTCTLFLKPIFVPMEVKKKLGFHCLSLSLGMYHIDFLMHNHKLYFSF